MRDGIHAELCTQVPYKLHGESWVFKNGIHKNQHAIGGGADINSLFSFNSLGVM